MNYTVKNKHIVTLLAAMAGAGSAFAQLNHVDVNLSGSPAAFVASNSSDTFSQTLASSAINAAGITPNATQANALQSTFDAAVAGLNGNASVLGSAANYQAARAALDANPASAALQSDLARSQAQYSTFNTTITNLKSAATITSGTSIATFSGVSGASLDSAALTASGGAIALAKQQADNSTKDISDAVSYFKQGAGASTSTTSYSDLESGVIAKIQPLNAGTVGDGASQYTVDGFRNLELNAYNTASTDLSAAQTAYAAAIGNPASTAGDIATAAGTLASAETAYANSVQNLYKSGFAPITDTKKNNLLGAVLNGSWERNAINSNTTAIVANADAITTETTRATAAEDNLSRGLQNEEIKRIVADTVLDDKITLEKNRATAAEGVLDGKISAETTRATAAEGVLTTNLNNEVSRATAAEGVLDGKITTEANTRAAADTAETNARIAADTAEAATRAAADTTLQANITAEATRATTAEGVLTTNLTKEVADRVTAVNTEKNRAVAAETALANRATALEGRVGRAEGRINSLRKGVSMAAALQTPVIEAGKQNAVKAGVATVDGAQGFGIAVARRINDSVQVNLDVATDFQTDTAARAGVNYSF